MGIKLKERHQWALALAFILSLAFLPFQNCSNANFASNEEPTSAVGLGNEDGGVVPTPTPAEPTFTQKVRDFSSASTVRKIDMVWVIDNSNSMDVEAAHVRKNFEAFMKGLESRIDIQVALISRGTPIAAKTQVSLPAGLGPQHRQIDYFVDSYNPALVVAASTCGSVVEPGDDFCEKVKSQPRYNRITGALSDFFRPDSQKVIVIVSDDDSSAGSGNTQIDRVAETGKYEPDSLAKILVENVDYIKPATFKDRMNRAFGGESSYKVYGFIGVNIKESPCRFRDGLAYESLVNDTAGARFNICSADWTPHFSSLAEKIGSYADTAYSLGALKLKRIVSVSVNGNLLASSQYSLQGNVVKIDSALVEGTGTYSVKVTYEEWDQ